MDRKTVAAIFWAGMITGALILLLINELPNKKEEEKGYTVAPTDKEADSLELMYCHD